MRPGYLALDRPDIRSACKGGGLYVGSHRSAWDNVETAGAILGEDTASCLELPAADMARP